MMKDFIYRRSVPVLGWGCSFDSLLELKYAIHIRDHFEFLRSHISIYFDPKTLEPTDYLRGNTRRYTPDFLIRHKRTGKAALVELKPRAFEHNTQLILRRQIAERYISWKKYDWSFTVVYDDEIRLNEEQQNRFAACCRHTLQSKRQLLSGQVNKISNRSELSFFKGAPSGRQVQFVMFGN